jgi:serine phosphatase RsbU (regulator of sigma subunit)
MYQRLINIAKKVWPEIGMLPPDQQIGSLGDVLGSLICFPLALAGMAWLISMTRPATLGRDWWLLILLTAFMALFSRIGFFIVVETSKGRLADMSGSLDQVFLWTGVFLLGPPAIWMGVFWEVANLALNRPPAHSLATRWNRLRNTILNIAAITISYLVAWTAYLNIGGRLPFPGLRLNVVLLAFVPLIIQFAIDRSFWLVYLLGLSYVRKREAHPVESDANAWRSFVLNALGLPGLALPFSILTAALYVEGGLGIFIFFTIGLLVVSVLTNRLSRAAERSRQQTRQLEQLELLSRAFLESPPDLPNLSELVATYVPSMFPYCDIEIRLFPDRTLLRHPQDLPPADEAVWQGWETQAAERVYLDRSHLPWQPTSESEIAWMVVPIINPRSGKTIGAIYQARLRSIMNSSLDLKSVLPVVQSLAATLASAQQQTEAYAQTLAFEHTIHELELAGSIQQNFLPESLPDIPGWQLSANLLPARQTSGDFYDVFQLPSGRIGLVIADVADKGMGAALYMALSRTLIHTYALELDIRPSLALASANHRILSDTRTDQFVTVFYGVLDPATGELTYANAGHDPPLVLDVCKGVTVDKLIRTGIPLGIQESTWEEKCIQLCPGQILLMYTDGIPDTQDSQAEFYGIDRMVAVVRANLLMPVAVLQRALLEDVQAFENGNQQFDDRTLVIVGRDEIPEVSA